jgi:hypothetical protein
MAITPRSAVAERRDGRENDVGLHPAEALEVERQRAQHFRRKVRDHDVRGRHQLLHDLSTLWVRGVQRHAALVPVHREVQRARAIRGDRRDPAVLTALAPLDADHVRAKVGQQRGAVGPRDVPAEIEDPDALKHTAQRALRLGHVDLLFGSTPFSGVDMSLRPGAAMATVHNQSSLRLQLLKGPRKSVFSVRCVHVPLGRLQAS